MKANRSKNPWKFFLPEKSIGKLAILASLLICLIANSALSQELTTPKTEAEPVDPVREKQKEMYFKELKEGKNTPVENQGKQEVLMNSEESIEPVAPVRKKQEEEYFKKLKEGKATSIQTQETPEEFSAEALPNWNDTGDFEADKAAYLLAVEGWLQRNASLYSEEELEFLTKPILSLEERQQNLINN